MREYGKNILALVHHVAGLEDRERRTQSAYTLVELMKQLNPQLKSESDQKLWDDLYIMSAFTLDVDGPYPVPEKELLGKQPLPIGYPETEIKFKHYGRNIELLIEKAIELENDEEQEAAIIYIGQLMKSFQAAWNRDNYDDGIILEDIRTLSKGRLHIDLERVREQGLFDTSTKRDFNAPPQPIREQNSYGNKKSFGHKNYKGRSGGGNYKKHNRR
ncbi:hypothetical protein A3SI_11619 [Nitritalea halalkaliphila LW7]|uniref:DUF4290 domain-containing protein n=1 Tax=Nitritalea halalkaliphila LW7 TaxID=1189621 RepID=I5C2F7_9BACT|nr:DUF4290 domain-containing protein [Nitritalea halalkaliphila]EIM76009.1 hypothetical protein A3SI_11619 [Nitritalea halalkaliphila LW7]